MFEHFFKPLVYSYHFKQIAEKKMKCIYIWIFHTTWRSLCQVIHSGWKFRVLTTSTNTVLESHHQISYHPIIRWQKRSLHNTGSSCPSPRIRRLNAWSIAASSSQRIISKFQVEKKVISSSIVSHAEVE